MNRTLTLPAVAVSILALAACSEGSASGQDTRKVAAQNQQNLLTSQPIPVLQHSEERENLINRAERLNQQNMTGCVSVFTPNGVLLYQGVVDGKVSSLNSYLLPSDEVKVPGSYDGGGVTIEAPDIDGAYGANADGVFFFNADSNAYIEAGNVTYIFTDQCLATTAKPLLVQSVPATQP